MGWFPKGRAGSKHTTPRPIGLRGEHPPVPRPISVPRNSTEMWCGLGIMLELGILVSVFKTLFGVLRHCYPNQSLDIRSWEAAASAAVQRALGIIDSTGVLSPADRANRGSGALPLHLCPPPYPTLSHHASVCACHRRCEGACKGRRLRYDPHGQPHRHHLRRRIGTGSASHHASACCYPVPPMWRMWAATNRPHVPV